MRGSGSESGLVKSIFRHGVCSAWLRAVAVVVLCLAGLLCASPAAQAADYYWDIGNTNLPPGPSLGDDIITGGTGTWGTGNTNWTTDGGAYNVIWGNTINDTAVFTDVGGTVAVNEVNAGGITFNNPSTTGYTLTPLNILHLGAGGVIQTLATDGSDGTQVNGITTKLQLMGTTATFSSNSAKSTMQIGNNITDTMTLGTGVSSATLTLNGTNTGLNRFGYASGDKAMINNRAIAVVKDGPGTWWLSGKLLFTGGLTIKEGTLVFSYRDDCLGTTGITLGNSAGGEKAATLVSGSSGRNISRPITLAGTTTGILTVGGGSGLAATTYSGGVTGTNNLTLDSRGTLLTMSTAAINNTGALTVKGAGNTTISFGIGSSVTSLTKNDGGTLTLSAANAYSGNTKISLGTLKLGLGSSTNNIASSVIIDIAAGAYLDATGLSGAMLELASGQTLKGAGTVTGALTVASGSILSPGSSPGTLTTGDQTWAGGGKYAWQLLDLAGPAGTGWDLADITGAGHLAVTATTDNKFNIVLQTLSSITPDVQGTPAGWNALLTHSWKIASSANPITTWDVADGLASNLFAIDATNFVGGTLPSTASFNVSKTGNDVYLNYVPEPATMGLLAIGGLALLRRRRASTGL